MAVNKTLLRGVPVNVIFCCQPAPVFEVAVMVLLVETVPPPNKVPVKVTVPDENADALVPTQPSNELILLRTCKLS